MSTLRFVVPGTPVPLERARRGQGRFYTPDRSAAYQARVRALAWEAMRAARLARFEGAVALDIDAVFGRDPQRAHLVVQVRALPEGGLDLWHADKPDLDNVVKQVADALMPARRRRAKAWPVAGGESVLEDDSLVAVLNARKTWIDGAHAATGEAT